MKTVAAVCNIGLFLFTFAVLATEGVSARPLYLALTLLLLAVPLLTSVLLLRGRMAPRDEQTAPEPLSAAGTSAGRVAVIGNLALIGLVCWAIADAYPHPEESGVIPYAVLAVLTPVLSVVALLGRTRHGTRREAKARA